MSTLGAVHLMSSLVAIVVGAIVMLMRKGTRWHRTWGHAYFWAMLSTVVTSLFLYRMTGRAGPFHVAAVIGGLTLIAGMWSVLGRVPKKNWIEAHATWMAWSYVGLMAAFVAETLSRFAMPMLVDYLQANSLVGAFWGIVAVGSFSAGAAGWWLIKTRLPGAVAATPAAMRAEREELQGG